MSFSFGAPSSAPATTGLTGFNFGANKPATGGFGLTATSQPSTGLFGITATTSAPPFGSTGFGTPAFGATTTPAFGATSTAPPFGTTSTAPAFGATTTPAFGALPFEIPSMPAVLLLPSLKKQRELIQGANVTPAFNVNSTPFGTGLGTGGLNFGTGMSTAAPTGGTVLTFATPVTTTSTGLGGLGGFGFGTSTATTQSTGFAPFGSISSATTTASLFGTKLGTTGATGTLLSTSVTPSLGLGGVAPTSGGIGTTSTTTTGDGKSEPPKQTKLPNEISTTVDSFKEFVKKQKSLSSDLMRVSIKPLHKVSREAEATLRLALSLSGEVSRGRAHSRRLRTAAAAALAAAEGAARDTAGSELEGTAPPAYIKDLISELEQQLITFRRQMDVADKQMQASPKLLTEQELTLGIRRMHESLVALAGRLQAVHTQVEAQKEQYLNLRKYVLKDPTDVFDTPSSSTSLDQILSDAEGTRKKTKSSALTDVTLGSAVLTDPRAALGSLQQLAGPTPFTYLDSTLSPFPNADTSGAGWQPQTQTNLNTSLNVSGFGAVSADISSGFQLQKPPGKRGKQ